MQEGRNERSLRGANIGAHMRVAAGHQGHNLGVELWIDMGLPYGHIGERPLLFHESHFLVVHASPRVLIVKVSAPGFVQTIVVAHAPHRGARLPERTAFWAQLTEG